MLDQLAPAYRPEDVYAGNYLGSLEAIDAGVTTLLDWSHINNTPEHADEAIRGLGDAKLRAVYCYGNPNTSLADWWYKSTLEAPEDIRRVREQYFSSDDGLLTLAMGTRGPGFCTPRWCGTTGSSRATSARRSACTSAWGRSQGVSRWSSS